MPLRLRMRPWMLGSAVWILPAIFAAISDIGQRRLNGDPPPDAYELLWSSGDWLIYAILAPGIFAVSNRWPIVRPFLAGRTAIHLAFAVLSCFAWAVGGKVLQVALMFTFRNAEAHKFVAEAGGQFWQRVGIDVAHWILNTLPFGVIVYICVAGMAHAIRYFVEARDREVQLARLSEQLTSARLSTLQAQLNPHFLFNSLNTIAVLTRAGETATAARVVEQLSDVLRSTLGRALANEVTLEDELELVRQYLAVEQARFPDRLRPAFEIDPGVLSAAVPSFALQHLVENALRHGIARRTDAGQVVVAARRDGGTLEITVADDGEGLAPDAPLPQPGHGLENTRERLRTLYPAGGASLELVPAPTRGTIARLRLPYREMVLDANVPT